MSFYTLVAIAGMLFGIKLTTILLVYPRITKRKSAANSYLAISFFSLSFVLLNAILSSTGLYIKFPYLVFTAHLGVYLFMPMMFFYVRAIIKQKTIRWKDFIHFLPIIIYLLDMGNQIFIGPEAKLDLLRTGSDSNDISLMIVQGAFTPPRFHLYLSTILFVGYVVAKISLVLRAYTAYGRNFIEDNRDWIKWTTVYCAMEILLIAPVCVAVYYDKSASSKELWDKSSILFSALSIFSTIYLFLNPKILYGLAGAVMDDKDVEEQNVDESQEVQQSPIKPSNVQYINQRELDRVEGLIQQHILQEERYLNSKYSVQDMAKDAGVPQKMISAYMNHRLQVNFNDFINRHRVEYCCKLMDDPENDNLTLERLSEMSGFGNRTTFIAAFKKFKQLSPSQYWKWVRSGEQPQGSIVSEVNE